MAQKMLSQSSETTLCKFKINLYRTLHAPLPLFKNDVSAKCEMLGFEHALIQQQTCSLDRNVQASRHQYPAILCQTNTNKE